MQVQIQTNNNRKYAIAGFIVIVIIYSVYNIYLVDVNYYNSIPRKVRHIARLLSILMVYGVGLYALKKYMEGWITSLCEREIARNPCREHLVTR